jgi:hypothetical protein
MTNEKKLVLLLDIAERALTLDMFEVGRRNGEADLDLAYRNWKDDHGITRVERDTPDWNRMIKATAVWYKVLEADKRKERNARKRLKAAIRRYLAAA